MSETTVTETAAVSETTDGTVEAVEEVVTPEIDGSQIHTQFDPMFTIYKNVADSANALAKELHTAGDNDKAALESILNESDDEAIAKWRESHEKGMAQIAEAQAKLEARKEAITAHARTLIPEAMSEEELAAKKAEFLQIRGQATGLRKTLLSLIVNPDEFAAKVKQFDISEVTGTSRGAAVTGNSIASKKPRISAAFVDEKDVAVDGKVSFTTLAKEIKADVNDLKAAAFKAAGTDDFKTISGQDVSFTFTVGDKSHTISITAA